MHPIALRKIALHIYSMLQSLRKTALMLEVSHMTISRWISKPERKKYERKIISKTDIIKETVKSITEMNPLVTLEDLQKKISKIFDFSISKDLLRLVRKKLNLSRKKVKFFSRPTTLEYKTFEFLKKRQEFIDKGYQFVSIDETSFGRHTKDVYGYSLKGESIYLKKTNDRVTTKSALVLIDRDQIVLGRVIIGSFNTIRFIEFLERLELPTNTVFLIDNCSFHHSKMVKELALKRGWNLLYVPPYSPWYNPIEGVFSIVKRKFYKCGDIKKSFKSVTKEHLNSFFDKSMKTTIHESQKK